MKIFKKKKRKMKLNKFNRNENIYTCRCIRFCQTAFSSGDGARNIICFLAFFRGVRVKSGVQCTVGLSAAIRPFGSIVIRNSVSVTKEVLNAVTIYFFYQIV